MSGKNILGGYGEFDLPEEKSAIEVVEDPVKAVVSFYDFWKKTYRPVRKVNYLSRIGADVIYSDFVNLFDEKIKKLKLNERHVPEILNVLKTNASHLDFTGLFLSFVINESDLKYFVITEFPKVIEQFGFKLKKDKSIFTGSEALTNHTGHFSEGNIINFAKNDCLSYFSEGGLVINYGYARTFAENSKNGVYITKTDPEYFGGGPATMITPSVVFNLEIMKIILMCDKSLSSIKQNLDDKLKETCIFDDLGNKPHDEILQKMKSFDFKKFEKDILEIFAGNKSSGV